MRILACQIGTVRPGPAVLAELEGVCTVYEHAPHVVCLRCWSLDSRRRNHLACSVVLRVLRHIRQAQRGRGQAAQAAGKEPAAAAPAAFAGLRLRAPVGRSRRRETATRLRGHLLLCVSVCCVFSCSCSPCIVASVCRACCSVLSFLVRTTVCCCRGGLPAATCCCRCGLHAAVAAHVVAVSFCSRF